LATHRADFCPIAPQEHEEALVAAQSLQPKLIELSLLNMLLLGAMWIEQAQFVEQLRFLLAPWPQVAGGKVSKHNEVSRQPEIS
jgi:hypothetical protein